MKAENLKPLLKSWFQYGKKTESMTIPEIIETIIEMEMTYKENDCSVLRHNKGVPVCVGNILKELGYTKKYTKCVMNADGTYESNKTQYYIRLNIPPWFKNTLTTTVKDTLKDEYTVYSDTDERFDTIALKTPLTEL